MTLPCLKIFILTLTAMNSRWHSQWTILAHSFSYAQSYRQWRWVVSMNSTVSMSAPTVFWFMLLSVVRFGFSVRRTCNYRIVLCLSNTFFFSITNVQVPKIFSNSKFFRIKIKNLSTVSEKKQKKLSTETADWHSVHPTWERQEK